MIAAQRSTCPSNSLRDVPNWHITWALTALLLMPVFVPLLRAQGKTAGETLAPAKRLAIAILWSEDKTANPELAHWRYATMLLSKSLKEVKAIRVLSDGAIRYAFR